MIDINAIQAATKALDNAPLPSGPRFVWFKDRLYVCEPNMPVCEIVDGERIPIDIRVSE